MTKLHLAITITFTLCLALSTQAAEITGGEKCFDNFQYGATDICGHCAPPSGIFYVNDITSTGDVLEQNRLGTAGVMFSGIELKILSQISEYETFFCRHIADNFRATSLDSAAACDLTKTLERTAAVIRGNSPQNTNMSRHSGGECYRTSPRIALLADAGAAPAQALGITENKLFVAVSTEFSFGAERGVTFGKRSLLPIIPRL